MITCITCRDAVMRARLLFNCSPIPVLSKVFDCGGCKLYSVKLSTPYDWSTLQTSSQALHFHMMPHHAFYAYHISFVLLWYFCIWSYLKLNSKFVHQCVCSPVKWVTISQCKGDLARTTLMDKIPLKL